MDKVEIRIQLNKSKCMGCGAWLSPEPMELQASCGNCDDDFYWVNLRVDREKEERAFPEYLGKIAKNMIGNQND